MWNGRLDEAQAGIKIAGRNVNSLRYADDATLMEESEEELKSFLMKVKEESEKTGISHYVVSYKLNKEGDNIQPWCTPSQFWTSLLFHVWF